VPAVSLLLEALKKAELAKQQGAASQPPESATPPAEQGSGGLALEPGPTDAGERQLITRDRLPDITQPLEILSEDLPSAGTRREPTPASAAATSVSGPAPIGPAVGAASGERAGRSAGETDTEDQDRLSARQLFEAKDMDYNPRRPFFIAIGVLGVAALAVIGYFLYQLYAPGPSYYTGPAPKSTPIATAPTAPSATPSTAAPATPAQPPQAAAPVIPPAASPAPTAAPRTAVPPAPQPTPATGATRPPRSPEATTRAPGAPARDPLAEPTPAPRATAPALPAIKVTRAEPRLDPALERAWQALVAGNLALAKEEYARVLAANPLDRDAQLGLATIDVRSQDYESAEARYLKVLELDPRNPYAQAGIIALRGHTDPVLSESRLKILLAHQPEATFLNFALGNQYALQGRWQDAQSAYFKAYSADPEHPDYAYNLAVSLDQLHQPKLALEYYQRALALARNRAVGFNSALIEARLRELAR
jgi:Tfp pilus assembly protein PilF